MTVDQEKVADGSKPEYDRKKAVGQEEKS